jgi:hypothetical protein
VVEGIVKELYKTGEFSLESEDGTIDYVFTEGIEYFCMSEPYRDKMEMQNHALENVDADYVWLVDSDEFYLQKDIIKIIDILKKHRPEQVNVPLYNFFKSPHWIVNSTDEMFKILTTEVPRIFKMREGLKFTNHRPPTVNRKIKKLISGRKMLRQDILMYHFPYCFYNQVMLKTMLYNSMHGHANLKEWFYSFFVPWDEENRERLEKEWGAWAPDKTSFTQRFKNIVPKAVKPIFKDMEGIKWED